MRFGELFIRAGTGTVFDVFIGKRASEHIEILDSDLGAGTHESKILDGLMGKDVISYIPGFLKGKRTVEKRPHMTVVLEAANCFKCAHRRGRSRVDPDLVGCENMRKYANYHTVQSEGCAMFKEATESELRRIAALDNMRIHEECE